MPTYPLPTLAPVIDSTGISAPPFEQIISSLQVSYQGIFGADAYIAPDSQPGQWIAILADAQNDTNQAIIAGYFAYAPNTAQGIGLASIVKVNGIRRLLPTQSSAELILIGQAYTQIVSGIVSDGTNDWALPSLVTIPAGGEIVATALCQTPGAVQAAAGTITQIINNQAGWQSATNAGAAIPGAPVETDAALRQRQAASTALPSTTPREAIYAAIANLPGVQALEVYQNDEDDPDVVTGIPGHSIAAVVAGGDAVQVCTAIAQKKSEGTGTFGTVSEVILDSMGVPDTINFFPLTLIPIYVIITIEPLMGYLSSTGNMIVAAVAAGIQAIGIGVPVYVARLWAPAGLTGDAAVASSGLSQQQLDVLAGTYVVRSIFIGPAPDPTVAGDYIVPFYAAAQGLGSNITLSLLV